MTTDTTLSDFLATQVHRIEDVHTGEIGSYEYPSLSDALAEIQDVTTWTRVRNHRDRVVFEINRPEGL